jgi:hypothetical protein
VSGRVQYVFNELSHGISKQQAGYEISKSRLTFFEAVGHWQHGGGIDIRVPLDALDLSQVTMADFPRGVGSTEVINLSGRSGTSLNDQLVYGNITLKLVAPNVVEAVLGYDRYNFDIKPWSADTWRRNVATALGLGVNQTVGSLTQQGQGLRPVTGQGFFIQIDGRAPIK